MSQMLLIVIVALIVVKPQRLPEISYFLGRFLKKITLFYQGLLEKSKTLL